MRPSPAAQKRDEYKNLPLNPRNHKKENLEFFSKIIQMLQPHKTPFKATQIKQPTSV
jgi:hypothetical protein